MGWAIGDGCLCPGPSSDLAPSLHLSGGATPPVEGASDDPDEHQMTLPGRNCFRLICSKILDYSCYFYMVGWLTTFHMNEFGWFF